MIVGDADVDVKGPSLSVGADAPSADVSGTVAHQHHYLTSKAQV
mgnify:CR=1